MDEALIWDEDSDREDDMKMDNSPDKTSIPLVNTYLTIPSDQNCQRSNINSFSSYSFAFIKSDNHIYTDDLSDVKSGHNKGGDHLVSNTSRNKIRSSIRQRLDVLNKLVRHYFIIVLFIAKYSSI